MSRSSRSEAVVLKSYPIGEKHKGVVLCTPQRGNIHAIAHGASGPRSRLKLAATPLAVGRALLYEDPGKNSVKITEWETLMEPEGLRSGISAYFAASIAAETMILTHTPRESREDYELFVECLQALDALSRDAGGGSRNAGRIVSAETIILTYLWRYLFLAGILPDLDSSLRSGMPISELKEACYSFADQAFVHPEESNKDDLRIPPPGFQMIRWLSQTAFERTRREPLPQEPLGAMFRLAVFLVEAFAGRRMKSVDAARGVLRFSSQVEGPGGIAPEKRQL